MPTPNDAAKDSEGSIMVKVLKYTIGQVMNTVKNFIWFKYDISGVSKKVFSLECEFKEPLFKPLVNLTCKIQMIDNKMCVSEIYTKDNALFNDNSLMKQFDKQVKKITTEVENALKEKKVPKKGEEKEEQYENQGEEEDQDEN
jgi:hypothetical protein